MGANIVGISALYHDAACCILKDGRLVAAAQEERFTRVKNDASMPYHAFVYCLQQANLQINEIDCLAYYENPDKKLQRQVWSGLVNNNQPEHAGIKHVEKSIRRLLGYEGPIRFYEHHQSHAASAFFYSQFDSAAILTIDGVGEWATTTYGKGEHNRISIFEEVNFPHSLGLLYSTITAYLNFEVNEGEYKVMGLASYGKPVYAKQIEELISCKENGQYELNLKYFDFIRGKRMYTDQLADLLGFPPRKKGGELLQCHCDLARSMQYVLEEVLLEKVNFLYNQTGEQNLCMAGGVALNCVANSAILHKGPFQRLFVQPAAGDAGCALGAAALAQIDITGEPIHKERLKHMYLGPAYDNKEIEELLSATRLKYKKFVNNRRELLTQTARLINDGKMIGWLNGRMEFGPRSLGARSILADPRRAEMKDKINATVKLREGFRPFAPAVLEEHAAANFDIDHPSPFMLETCTVIATIPLPAITHVDGTARLQTVNKETNPLFAELLEEFLQITGCPVLLNTSFNIKGEPIVCTPENALACFLTTNIDCLVLGEFLIEKEDNSIELLAELLQDMHQERAGITHDVYTFI